MTAFGRLDVYFPDGRSQSYPLTGDDITVGRGAGCAIRLDDDAVSARHFRIRHGSGLAHITDLDSAGGTFVDGERLRPNSPQRLKETTSIQIGALRITCYLRSDSPTVAMGAILDQTQPTPVGFRAQLSQPALPVWPGSAGAVELAVDNQSDQRSDFLLETAGLPEAWLRPARLNFSLRAGDQSAISLQIKPARRADTPPGDYPLAISITRLGENERVVRLSLLVKLGGFGGLSLALDPPVIAQAGAFSLYLLNQGNEELRLRLTAQEPPAQLDIRLAQAAVKLAPGERAHISGDARARRRHLVGGAKIQPFALLAKTEDPSQYCVALPANLAVRPRLSSRILAVAALALALAAIGLLSHILQPPAPAIASFSLANAQVAQGRPVALSWRASDAGHYVIEVDRAAVAELPASAETYLLDTSAYTDPVQIALIAVRGDFTAIQKRELDVYQPVIVKRFESDRPAMLRHVTGTIAIRWEITGAVELDISKPPGFVTTAESSLSDIKGEMVLRGIPEAEFQIQLRARDEIGAITERRLSIMLREPECTPLVDAALFAGPDSRFPRRAIAVANVPVLVSGISESQDWLRLELASGAAGWAQHSGFNCQGFNPGKLRVIRDLPQPPAATATRLPTATPTETAAAQATPADRPPSSPASSTAPTADAPQSTERSSG